LIALLIDAPLPLSWQAEELLFRLAADGAPTVSVGSGDAEARKKCRAAWTAWWREQGPALDLSRFDDVERQLGLTVIAELDSNKVWECGLDGKPRWQLTGLLGPIDAQVLPGGRVLVAENRGQRVTERDLQGRILWQKQVPSNPICCQRLPNGNTFIATYQSVLEVTRDGKEVYSHHPAAAPFIFGAQKLRNGHIVYISAQNTLVEMEPTGKEVRRVPVTTNGNWCSVEALPGGQYLVALMWNGKVAEVDAAGKEVRAITVPGVCSATRLPNGNPLVACMSGNRVAEYDWTGKKVREIFTAGRPFHAHRR
jgi:PQQ-like domain